MAGSIGPDCGTCQGSIYTLTNLGLAPADLSGGDGSFDTYRIMLAIDTSGYNGGGAEIDEVAVKVSSSIDQVSLVSAPGVLTDWALQAGGIGGKGCDGSGSGFDCADWVGTSAANHVGGTLVWVFDVDVASALFTGTGTDAPSIKVRYTNEDGTQKVGALVSENITLSPTEAPPSPVPEPGTLILLAIGGVATAFRRLNS